MTSDVAAFLDNPGLVALGWTLLHALWQGALIAAAAALALRATAHRAATTRYAIACIALLTLPAACAVTLWRITFGNPAPLGFSRAPLAGVAPWIACAWIAGVGMASLRLAAGWRRVLELRRTATPGATTWQAATDTIAARLGVRHPVRLMKTAIADVPGAIGWLSPMILFPAEVLAGLAPGQVQLLIAHELAHVRRHDYLANLVQTAIETLFFFHPAVWWLSSRIREERERCCDDIVVAEFSDRHLYAETLAAVERIRARSSIDLAVAAAGGNLLARISRIVEGPDRGAPAMWRQLAVAGVFAFFAAAAFAAIDPGLPAGDAGAAYSLWFGAALGLGVGMRHALEPDHLAAVSTLVADRRDAAQAARLGLAWGVGHTLSLFVVGGALALVRVTMPARATDALEAVVGVMLIALGLRALHSAWLMGTAGPEAVHAHGSLVHRHRAGAEHVHIGGLTLAPRPLMVGTVHGLAGSGALAALAMTTLPSPGIQIVFIVLFGLGSTLGMAALSGIAGLPLARLARRPLAFAWASAAAGAASLVAGFIWIGVSAIIAQTAAGVVQGTVADMTGGRLQGVTVMLTQGRAPARTTITDAEGQYRFEGLGPGRYDATFTFINFAPNVRSGIEVSAEHPLTLDVILHLKLSADVTVTGWRTFTNLADVENPEANLVGIAGAASEGAITAKQILDRPIMRAGEVLETVPGLVISQHSGEGKANQYYLRGFNLDHGTDFATTIAGIPVNLPTHGHGHGYTDANFLIPELVSGVQFRKGPYYAEEGDFSAAGAVNVNYANSLERPIVEASGGGQGWARVLAAASPKLGDGHVLAALELNHNDGPWTLEDDYRKVNGVVRYSEGDATGGFSVTGLLYRGEWNATDQVPQRAIDEDAISRFGHIDPTGGGETHRSSLSTDAQWASNATVTRANAYFVNYGLNLFSNFTYFLDDPENGDQFEQEDRRNVFGGRITHRILSSWGSRAAETSFGAQVRHDRIGSVGLYRTRARQRLSTTREDRVGQTSLGLFAQSEYRWSPVVRTTVGLRGDVVNFDVDGDDPLNSGSESSALVSPKGSVVVGPWSGTEFYANAGFGFHSNDARGATTTRDPSTGETVEPTTPLVRARGAEIGMRTVRIPNVQMTVAVWALGIDSELLFIGDAGTTEATRPSRRVGVEWTTYARPHSWVSVDADIAISRARFTDDDPAGNRIPGSVESVVSLGAVVDNGRRAFGGLRLRHFGARSLVEDDSVRSKATSLVNAQFGIRLAMKASVVVDIFNLFDAEASDIDYFYASRLPGEPEEGIDDIHTHPALPRSARVSLRLGF
jgi:beta-lactamase regulating signal transducer with metallopeptidase domain